jgi:hypothetical protein
MPQKMPPNTTTAYPKGVSHSGRAALDNKLSDWLEWNVPGSPDHAAVANMIEKAEFDDLDKMMMPRKLFGTAGIRAEMGPG